MEGTLYDCFIFTDYPSLDGTWKTKILKSSQVKIILGIWKMILNNPNGFKILQMGWNIHSESRTSRNMKICGLVLEVLFRIVSPIWSILDLFGSIWSILDRFEVFWIDLNRFEVFWIDLKYFGSIWVYLDPFVNRYSSWTCLNSFQYTHPLISSFNVLILLK